MTGPEIRKEAEKNPLKYAEDHLGLLKQMGVEMSITAKVLTRLFEHTETLVSEVKRLNLCIDGVQERYLEAKKLGLSKITDGLVLEPDNVEWVVNDIAELGVKIGNQIFFMYKSRSLVYDNEDSEMLWRPIYKREFGETVKVPTGPKHSDRGELDEDHHYSFGEGWAKLPKVSPLKTVLGIATTALQAIRKHKRRAMSDHHDNTIKYYNRTQNIAQDALKELGCE